MAQLVTVSLHEGKHVEKMGLIFTPLKGMPGEGRQRAGKKPGTPYRIVPKH